MFDTIGGIEHLPVGWMCDYCGQTWQLYPLTKPATVECPFGVVKREE